MEPEKLSGVGLIVGVPGKMGDTGHTDTEMLVSIFEKYHSQIHVFTGPSFEIVFTNPRVHVHKVRKPLANSSLLLRFLGQFWYQCGLAYDIAKYSKGISINYFTVGGELLFIPIVVSALLRQKRASFVLGSIYRSYLANYAAPLGKILAGIVWLGQNLGYILMDKIIILSQEMIKFGKLEKFKAKIIVWHYYFLDTNRFHVQREFAQREKIVGYIGRTAKVKGFIKFIEAIPIILSRDAGVRFIIIGDGEQLEEGKARVAKYGIADKVEFKGWLPRNDLPRYMNEIRLLAMPSVSEALPNVLIEAMACGAVPVATLVGDIPFLLKDKKTGFALKDNSPETIAQSLTEALSRQDLAEISRNASQLANELYNYEAASRGYYQVLQQVLEKDL